MAYNTLPFRALALLLVATPVAARMCAGSCQQAAQNSIMSKVMAKKVSERTACEKSNECPLLRGALSTTPCSDGMAGEYPCNDVDLASFVPVSALGGEKGTNDIWGWSDPDTGKEYALVGLVEGTSFVDITDPARPHVVGMMRTETRNSIWRDLKVYGNHVFVVSEAANHGMQIFDLTHLRGIAGRDATGVRPGAIKNRHANNLCLEVASESSAARMQECSDDNLAQHWTYDRQSGLVENKHSMCLTADVGETISLRAQACNSTDAAQQWVFIEVSSRFMNRYVPLCLQANRSIAGEQVLLQQCDADDSDQQWTLGSSLLQLFTPDAVYTQVTSSHNIVINEQTATAFIVGTETCNGGLHIVDISAPTQPDFVGCFSEDNYTHDAQCTIYEGPDKRYHGNEICFAYNEDTLTIVDVTDRNNSKVIARVGYNNSVYTHQGWLDEGHEYIFMNDELDEASYSPDAPDGPSNHTRTLIWDVRLLDSPVLSGSFYSNETSIDHNLYVDGSVVFQSNYCAGLRVMEISQPDDAGPVGLKEIGHLDVEPDCNTPSFRGTWSNFPYFKNGAVAVTSISRGLFVTMPRFTGRTDLESTRASSRQRLRQLSPVLV